MEVFWFLVLFSPPIVGLLYLIVAFLGSWLSIWNGPLCCRHCREIIPNPGEPGQCRSCGYFYDDSGRTIGEPAMLATISKVDLNRFHPTDNAANDERLQLQREPGYKEMRDA
jgi:hypothetical protein